MQASKEETLTLAMETIVMGAVISLMHATHNPVHIIGIATEAIRIAVKEEKENAPTTKTPKLNALDNEQVQEIVDAQAEANKGGN